MRRLRHAATVVSAAYRGHRARRRFRKRRRTSGSASAGSGALSGTMLGGERCTGRCFSCAYEQHASVRHALLRTTMNRNAINDEDTAALCAFLDAVTSRGESFIFLHDLREMRPWIARTHVFAVRRWVSEHSDQLEQNLKATCIVLRNPVLMAVVNWLIKVIGPTQPTRLVPDLPAALDFLHEHFAAPVEPSDGPMVC